MVRGAVFFVAVLLLVFGFSSFVLAMGDDFPRVNDRGERLFRATDIEYVDKEDIKRELKDAVRDAVHERRQEIKELQEDRQQAIDMIRASGGKRSYHYHLDRLEGEVDLLVEEQVVTDERGEEVVERLLNHNRAKVKTRLRLKQADDVSMLRVELSDGKEVDVDVLPGDADRIARQRLGTGRLDVELVEEDDLRSGKKRLMYHMRTEKDGKLFGFINTKVSFSGRIDPETGEVVDVDKPWWSFLVTGEDDSDGTEESYDSDEVDDEVVS